MLDVFEGTIPEHAEWSVRNEIVEVINKIGIKNLNHMLYPDNGGLDVVGCNVSDLGSDMIEILTAGNTPNLCNPLKLIFDSLDKSPEWSYFILELNSMEASGFYSERDIVVEEVFECGGEMEPYSEYPSHQNLRHILRILKGRLLIVPKTCYYNQLPSTYSGEHNKYDSTELRKVMNRLKEGAGYSKFLEEIAKII